MDWQPIVVDWVTWPPWKWCLLLLIVWHGVIGRANAVRWIEALGWNGALGLLTRIGWVQQPPPEPASKSSTSVALIKP